MVFSVGVGVGMEQIINAILNVWCAGAIGFFLGMLGMFILSCLRFAKVYDKMMEMESELREYEKIGEVV